MCKNPHLRRHSALTIFPEVVQVGCILHYIFQCVRKFHTYFCESYTSLHSHQKHIFPTSLSEFVVSSYCFIALGIGNAEDILIPFYFERRTLWHRIWQILGKVPWDPETNLYSVSFSASVLFISVKSSFSTLLLTLIFL